MKSVRSEVVDCIFADPPFNLGKNYNNGYSDNLDKVKYLRWCKAWIEEGIRLLKPGGAFFIYATPELAVHFANFMNASLAFRHWIALTMKGTYPRGRKLSRPIMRSCITRRASLRLLTNCGFQSPLVVIVVVISRIMAVTATS